MSSQKTRHKKLNNYYVMDNRGDNNLYTHRKAIRQSK